MVRKLNGGGCGCGSSGLLGFPQNGGQMNANMTNVPSGKKHHSTSEFTTSNMALSGTTPRSKMSMAKSPAGFTTSDMALSGTAPDSNTSMASNSSMGRHSRKMSTKHIMHSNGKSLNQHIDNIHSQLNKIQSAQASTNTSSGLFGGGLFDFFAPKTRPPMPVAASSGISQTTLPHNQPPTLQEVVRDLQFRVKTLEEELRPSSVGGYRATKRNLNALKKWKQGKSIGFTMRSSLKAKGLIPRANGTRRVSKKYRG